jgi:hypothetical protein
VLGHDVAAKALLGALVAAADPADGQAPGERRKTDAQPQEDLRERELRGQRNREKRQRRAQEHGSGRPEPVTGGVGDGAADDSPGLDLLSEESPPRQGERKQRGNGQGKQPEARRLGRRVRDRPLPEPLPARDDQEDGYRPGGEPDGGIESRREGGPEAADPVGGRRGNDSLAGRMRKEARVSRIVRKQRQGDQHPRQEEENTDRFAGEAPAPEGSLTQSIQLWGRTRRNAIPAAYWRLNAASDFERSVRPRFARAASGPARLNAATPRPTPPRRSS